MNSMRTILVFCFLICVKPVTALDVKDVLAKMQQQYAQAEGIAYKSRYELFKGSETLEPVNVFEGYIYRKGKSLYQKIDHSEFIYGTDFFLKIDHEEGLMELENTQQALSAEIDLEAALKACTASEVSEEKENYIVKLIYAAGTQMPFSSVVLRIAKKNYTLLALDLYYAAAQDFSSDIRHQELDLAHLRITFSDFSMNPKPQDALLALSNYIETSGETLLPKVPFATYVLKDNRLK